MESDQGIKDLQRQMLALREAQVDLASVPSAATSLAGVVSISSALFEFAKVVIDTRAPGN
jgi:hypothetical protein